jgi:hypothetical protein
MWFNCQSGLVLLTDYNDYPALNLSKFRVTKISVSYITGENDIGSCLFIFMFIKYFCLPTKIAVLPSEASNKISSHTHHAPVAPGLVSECDHPYPRLWTAASSLSFNTQNISRI